MADGVEYVAAVGRPAAVDIGPVEGEEYIAAVVRPAVVYILAVVGVEDIATIGGPTVVYILAVEGVEYIAAIGRVALVETALRHPSHRHHRCGYNDHQSFHGYVVVVSCLIIKSSDIFE